MKQISLAILVTALAFSTPARAQRDPWADSWRGTLSTPQGGDTGLTLTLVADEGGYGGVVTGFAPGTEVRLSSVETDDVQVTITGTAQTAFGPLALTYSLTREDRNLAGGGRITLGEHGFDVEVELSRRRRAEVPQPQVDQQISFFSGTWAFEYTGGEFPPLSIGTRSGTVTFSDIPQGPFVRGQVTGEVFGDGYEDTWTIGFDEGTQAIYWQEQLSTGQYLLGLGDWTSPIGITFLTAPVESEGKVYVLKRLVRVTSNTAFSVSDEFSVDGGPFRRLGDGAYLRAE